MLGARIVYAERTNSKTDWNARAPQKKPSSFSIAIKDLFLILSLSQNPFLLLISSLIVPFKIKIQINIFLNFLSARF
jgi:hypothetical protein